MLNQKKQNKKQKEDLTIGVCIPTVRVEAIVRFMEQWAESFQHSLDSGFQIFVFVHEDAPTAQAYIADISSATVRHTCHTDLESELLEKQWIIPRGSGACRSFPMYLAWKAGCEFIITLDDDCFPLKEDSTIFFEEHLNSFQLDQWFRTIDGLNPRGIPYGDRGILPVLLNHGVWCGVPDLDGPTSLFYKNRSDQVILRSGKEVIPPGMFFPLCAMNVCYHRLAIPAAYNLLMGFNDYGFDRFDDIWSGLLLKKIADHLGYYITNGRPFVVHSKASNPFENNRKESLGIHVHEFFWKHIAVAPLNGKNIIECYGQMAEWVKQFPVYFPEAPDQGDYFERLGKAMNEWLSLFED